MFSGLVTAKTSVLKIKEQDSLLELNLKRPQSFEKLKIGESIALNGICLTLKSFDDQSMNFDLGPETLQVTGWTAEGLKNKVLNLELSLTLKDTVGGQILTGHVDGLAVVTQFKKQGESYFLTVQIPKKFKKFIWEKGYLALNGVSLTVNKIKGTKVDLCLIPETLKQSNLSLIKIGDSLNFEVDYMSRSSVQSIYNFYQKIKLIVIITVFSFVLLALLLILALFIDHLQFIQTLRY